MKKHKISLLFLATLATFCSSSAFAALNSYTHANGSTVININQADANGLSHNMYQNFDVTNKGSIINNSTTDLVRESGNIARNSNLDRSASLILNEVISTSPSTLNGFIEVAGQKADVIIANPNGISCSGCSFINTGRATLTTGTPTFSDGTLTGFKVAKGTISVNGKGLKGADYTDLLAKKINIQGMIETSQLKAIAGTYDYDIASAQVTANGNTRLFSNSIDVSELGGATAGIIQLQTTEAGAGVNNSGILNASGLYIASNGALTNSGTLQSGVISASASNDITNKGHLSSAQTALQTSSTFNNSGTIETTDYINVVSAGKFSNSENAQITAAGNINVVSIAGDIENTGKISAGKNLLMQTGYGSVDGTMTAIANTRLLNSGSLQAGNISLNAVKEIKLSLGGDVTTQGTAYLSASKVSNAATLTGQNTSIVANEVQNSGLMQTTGTLSVYGKNNIMNTGTLKAGTLALTTDEKISNSSCILWVLCIKGTMAADKITITAPKIASLSNLDGYYSTQTLELNKPAASSESAPSL